MLQRATIAVIKLIGENIADKNGEIGNTRKLKII